MVFVRDNYLRVNKNAVILFVNIFRGVTCLKVFITQKQILQKANKRMFEKVSLFVDASQC